MIKVTSAQSSTDNYRQASTTFAVNSTCAVGACAVIPALTPNPSALSPPPSPTIRVAGNAAKGSSRASAKFFVLAICFFAVVMIF